MSDQDRVADDRPWCCNQPMIVKVEYVYGRDYICPRCGKIVEEDGD